MYQHIQEPLSFRLSAWPWGGSSYITTYDHDIHNIKFRPLLDFIRSELERSPTVKVRKTTFTLVNVYSKFTDISYGSLPSPPKRLYNGRGAVVFTFAMMRREPAYDRLNAPHVIWNTGNTCLWGPNLQYGHDYLTVIVPLDLCMQCGLNVTLRRQMEWLYRIVGGFSKAYAIKRRPLELAENARYRDRVYFRTIPNLLWYYNEEDWKYAREFWDRAPHLLDLSEVTDSFTEYFLTYLRRYLNMRFDGSEAFFKQLEENVRSMVLDGVQKGSFDDSPIQKFIPSSLLDQLSDGGFVDVESVVKSICSGSNL